MASKKELVSDQRFTRVTKDPRFWEMPERDRKIKIDKRFQSMFHDKKFKLKYTVDKRGRPLHHTSTEDLKRFYNLSDSESELPKSDDRLNRNRAKGERATSTGVRDAGKSPSVRLMGDSCPSVSEFGNSRNDNPKHKYKSKKNLQETELITSLKGKELTSNKQGRIFLSERLGVKGFLFFKYIFIIFQECHTNCSVKDYPDTRSISHNTENSCSDILT